MRSLADKLKAAVVYAGDIFNNWDAPAELINFAIKHLPFGYAIPGQHDLPNHDYGQLKRSAYYTLMKAEAIKDLGHDKVTFVDENRIGFWIYPFPFGFPITPLNTDKIERCGVHLCVAHAYVWVTPEDSYVGAPVDRHVSNYRNGLKGYGAAHFGDNHHGFLLPKTDKHCPIFNGGTFVRRRIDERDCQTRVGVLHADGHIQQRFLDVSCDKIEEPEDALLAGDADYDPEELIEELKALGDKRPEFEELVKREMRNAALTSVVRDIVLKCLKEVKRR